MGSLLLVLLVMAVLAGLIWLGYWLAREDLADEHAELDIQRQVLDIEWTALEQTRRVNDVFFQARDELRKTEAEAHLTRPTDPTVIETEAVDVRDEPWRSEWPR